MKKATAAPFSPFVFDTATTFRWPVTVLVPSTTSIGKKEKTRFIGEFKHVDEDRRREILAEHRAKLERARKPVEAEDGVEAESEEDLAFGLSQTVLSEVLVCCHDILGPDRQPIEWSEGFKRQLILHQMVWPALYAAYMAALSQQDPAGNSQPSR